MSYVCSVVIPTHNAATTLEEQLAALAAQDVDASFEVIVADNGSTDESAAVARRWSDRLDLRVVDASSRRGPSAARNIGAACSEAPRLLFCDADDVVSQGWVRALTEALESHAYVGGIYEPFAEREGIWLPHYDLLGLPMAWSGRSYAFGGNFGVTAGLWDELGGFDETLTGAEEIEFAWRAHDVGSPPAFVPEAVVRYRVRSSLRGRLWHEYNSGRGTTVLAARLLPASVPQRRWRSQARHNAILLLRFPRRGGGAARAAWAATLAYEAGARAGRRQVHRQTVRPAGA